MRAPAIVAIVLLVAPIVGSLAASIGVRDIAPLPADLSDGDLLRLLSASVGRDVPELPPVEVAPGETVASVSLRLAERAGVPMTAEEASVFDGLHARVAAPVTLLLVTVEAAWDARDIAFSGLTAQEQAELMEMLLAERYDEPRLAELAAGVNEEQLIASAILLLDTLEGIVMPQLEAAIAAGAWPPMEIADPVGVLRLGSPGDDYENKDRIVQLDPSGNDRYENNAGGTTLLTQITNPLQMRTAIAVSVDFAGNDVYHQPKFDGPAQGGSFGGIGASLDLSGDDSYFCVIVCQGASGSAVGLMRDYAGNDEYVTGQMGLGAGNFGIGIARDDLGDDTYGARGSGTGGYGTFSEAALGLLWDRAGTDDYLTDGFADDRYGWGINGGRGWMVDEGAEVDFYETESHWKYPHGCNDCLWSMGSGFNGGPVNGHGNDRSGGLAFVLAHQNGLT